MEVRTMRVRIAARALPIVTAGKTMCAKLPAGVDVDRPLRITNFCPDGPTLAGSSSWRGYRAFGAALAFGVLGP